MEFRDIGGGQHLASPATDWPRLLSSGTPIKELHLNQHSPPNTAGGERLRVFPEELSEDDRNGSVPYYTTVDRTSALGAAAWAS